MLAIAEAFTFVWLGLVLGISFLEAPLKFRAPGVTTALGLGIGRIVFRALNVVEVVLALGLIALVAIGGLATSVVTLAGAVVLCLVIQLVAVRASLNRRTDRILAGESPPRSRAHLVYIGLEVFKAGGLLALGVLTIALR